MQFNDHENAEHRLLMPVFRSIGLYFLSHCVRFSALRVLEMLSRSVLAWSTNCRGNGAREHLMKRFRSILLIADTEDKQNIAFERAARIALRNQARLTVACTVKPAPEIQGLTAGGYTASSRELLTEETIVQD